MESSNQDLIRKSIIQDMSEGVMTIGMGGVISTVNPAAERILRRSAEELEGSKFAVAFFGCEENDSFNQTVLDALYDKESTHENFVPYFTGKENCWHLQCFGVFKGYIGVSRAPMYIQGASTTGRCYITFIIKHGHIHS